MQIQVKYVFIIFIFCSLHFCCNFTGTKHLSIVKKWLKKPMNSALSRLPLMLSHYPPVGVEERRSDALNCYFFIIWSCDKNFHFPSQQAGLSVWALFISDAHIYIMRWGIHGRRIILGETFLILEELWAHPMCSSDKDGLITKGLKYSGHLPALTLRPSCSHFAALEQIGPHVRSNKVKNESNSSLNTLESILKPIVRL